MEHISNGHSAYHWRCRVNHSCNVYTTGQIVLLIRTQLDDYLSELQNSHQQRDHRQIRLPLFHLAAHGEHRSSQIVQSYNVFEISGEKHNS